MIVCITLYALNFSLPKENLKFHGENKFNGVRNVCSVQGYDFILKED